MGDFDLQDAVQETHDGDDFVVVRTKKSEISNSVWEFWWDAETGEFSGYTSVSEEDGSGLRIGPYEPEDAPQHQKEDAYEKAKEIL